MPCLFKMTPNGCWDTCHHFLLLPVYSSHVSYLELFSFLVTLPFPFSFPVESILTLKSSSQSNIFPVLCTWTLLFDQDVGFVLWSFDYYKHYTLGLPLEKPQMQWHSPTRFNGIATYWRDPSVLRSKYFLWHFSICQRQDEKVKILWMTKLFKKLSDNHLLHSFWSFCCCFQIWTNIPD